MIQNGADYDENTSVFRHPLYLAVTNGHLNIVKEYIEILQFDINQNVIIDLTCLMLTVMYGHIDILDYLLEMKSLNLEIEDKDKRTAFHKSFNAKNSVDVISRLITRGCNVNHPDIKGFTPLFYCKTLSQLNHLIIGGANINACDNKGNTALHWAIINREDSNLIKGLISYGCNINIQNIMKYAHINGQTLQILLNHGILPETQKHKNDCLFCAVLENESELAQQLLKLGANPNPIVTYQFKDEHLKNFIDKNTFIVTDEIINMLYHFEKEVSKDLIS